MVTSNAALPPMAKISMIGIWIATVLYGVNCVMYGLCMFVLLRGGKVPALRWVILVTCTILFLLCTVHVGASLQQLLEAFVYAPADVPDYSTLYWLDNTTTLRILKNNLYDTLVLFQEFMLIWRLYVVFMCDWRVVVFPIILAAGYVAIPYTISAMSALPNGGLYGSVEYDLVIAASVLGMILNFSITVAIAWRLWWMGRKLALLTATWTNQNASSIYVVVESGAIFAAANIVILALYASNSPALMPGLDVASQLAVLTPLLMVVQVGLTNRYYIPSGDSSSMVQEKITFRAGVPQRQESQHDLPLQTTPSRSSGPMDGAHV